MDPGTAGSVGFLIRLVTLALAAAVALRVAGLNAGTLAVVRLVGGALAGQLEGIVGSLGLFRRRPARRRGPVRRSQRRRIRRSARDGRGVGPSAPSSYRARD
jgi:small conductance mechanosensitive channel